MALRAFFLVSGDLGFGGRLKNLLAMSSIDIGGTSRFGLSVFMGTGDCGLGLVGMGAFNDKRKRERQSLGA